MNLSIDALKFAHNTLAIHRMQQNTLLGALHLLLQKWFVFHCWAGLGIGLIPVWREKNSISQTTFIADICWPGVLVQTSSDSLNAAKSADSLGLTRDSLCKSADTSSYMWQSTLRSVPWKFLLPESIWGCQNLPSQAVMGWAPNYISCAWMTFGE